MVTSVSPTEPPLRRITSNAWSKLILYTVSAEQGVQGKVVVQFIVGVHGEILNPVVVKSVDPYLDKEAIRVISSMPKWKPGKQRGKAVRVKYTVPVVFRLQS